MLKSIGVLIIAILFLDTVVITVAFIRQNNTLTKAGTNATALQSEVNHLNGELATLRGNVTVLQSRLADSDAKAAALQTGLNTAEANVTALKNNLNKTLADYTRVVLAANAAAQRGAYINYDPGLGVLAPYDFGMGFVAP